MKRYVLGQAALGYAVFDPGPEASDVILVSFPKSGSTWTSYLLHQIRSGGDEAFADIKDEVVDITPGHWDPRDNPFQLAQRYVPRTFKTHGSYGRCPKGGKYIYIARDPADILLSLYHFIHDLFGMTARVPMDQFYHEFFVTRFGTDHDIGNVWRHLLEWYPQHVQTNTLWLHYEDLIADKRGGIETLARFMGVELPPVLVERIVPRAEMSHMRTIARKLNPSQENRVGRVVLGFGAEMQAYARDMRFGKIRAGQAGQGNRELPAEILVDLERQWRARITPVLGFEDYAAMRRAA
jgi:hypothetical protein